MDPGDAEMRKGLIALVAAAGVMIGGGAQGNFQGSSSINAERINSEYNSTSEKFLKLKRMKKFDENDISSISLENEVYRTSTRISEKLFEESGYLIDGSNGIIVTKCEGDIFLYTFFLKRGDELVLEERYFDRTNTKNYERTSPSKIHPRCLE